MHHLFLIHGMGAHEVENWADNVINKLDDVSKRYQFYADHDLRDLVKFHPVSYDDLFEEIIDSWKNEAGNMVSFIRNNDIDPGFNINSIQSWFDNADDKERKFFWTHVADVLIYRYFITLQAQVRAFVALQFVQKINWIKDNYPDNQNSSLLAHSLGTSVSHDSLHMLGTNMLTQYSSFQAGTNWTFQTMYALANVSKVLQTDFDPYSSVIKPATAGNNSYFNSFGNFKHKWDLFTKPQKFSPQSWADFYSDVEFDHYHDWNIHSFEHYIDHPRVHIPLLRGLIQNSVTIQERSNAFSYYEQNKFGESFKCINEIRMIIDKELIPLYNSISESSKLESIIPHLVKAYIIIDKIKITIEECIQDD